MPNPSGVPKGSSRGLNIARNFGYSPNVRYPLDGNIPGNQGVQLPQDSQGTVLPGASPNNPSFDQVFDSTRFPNFTVLNGTVGTKDLVVSPSPPNQRVFLFILNDTAAGGSRLRVNFNNQASSTSGLPLAAAGGFILLDETVDQSDIHIFGETGTATYVVIVANGNIYQP